MHRQVLLVDVSRTINSRKASRTALKSCLQQGLAFRNAYYLEKSCEIQLATQSLGGELVLMSEEMVNVTGREKTKIFRPPNDLGQLEWDALIRQLDREDTDFRR